MTPRLQKTRVFLAKTLLIFVLLFGKERPSALPAEMASWPRPCWLRQDQWSGSAGTADAGPGRGTREAGLPGQGPGTGSHTAGPGAALEDRPVTPRGGAGVPRRRIRRRLRRTRRGPQRSPRRTRHFP